jgi:hypothetical protein
MNSNELVQRIKKWQANPHFHPLTCGVDSGHEILEPVEKDGKVSLVCPTCGWVQSYMPAVFDLPEPPTRGV